MKYWCPECEDFHEIVELSLPSPFQRKRPPRDSVSVIKDSLIYLFQWIEDVQVTVDGTTLHLKIKHSYPKGISPASTVRQWLKANLVTGATATTKYQRVAPVKRGR